MGGSSSSLWSGSPPASSSTSITRSTKASSYGAFARLSLSGTFSGAALGMVAGRVAIEALDDAALAHLEALGERLRAGLRAACARAA